MIGHLQTNKVKKCLQIFDTIHSLDSINLADEIDKQAKSLGKRIDCLVQVNVSGEDSKYGISPEETEAFIRKVSLFSNIHIAGLMTMAPFVDNPEQVRPFFRKIYSLKESLRKMDISNTDVKDISMGMTQDFEVAIEEGATFVRIGTAIFK